MAWHVLMMLSRQRDLTCVANLDYESGFDQGNFDRFDQLPGPRL